jgi:hypothetical protein
MAHEAIVKDRPRGLLSLPVELLNNIVIEIVGDEYPGTFDYRYISIPPIPSIAGC